MDILLNKTRKVDAINSITNDISTEVEDKFDTEKPLTFLEWVQRSGLSSEVPEEYMSEYTSYLQKWTTYNKLSSVSSSQLIISRYKALLKDIALNYTTDEEKRFLSNINYNNPRHVESALPFFARKLKQIALYYTQERDNIKQQQAKIKLSGTTQGTTELAYKYIPQLLQRDDFTLRYQDNTVEISSENIYSNFRVDIDELYDISQEYFKKQNTPIDIDTFANITTAIEDILQECKPVLKLSTGASLILDNGAAGVDTEVTNEDIDTINASYFTNYTNTIDNLNIYGEREYIPTLIGSTISYLSGGTLTEIISSDTIHRNIFNRHAPVINNRTAPILKSVKELGGYFIPTKLGLLTYYSSAPDFKITSDTTSMTVPDLHKYGNSASVGVTGIPVEHIENVEWLKAGVGAGRLKGDIINARKYPKFYNYSSVEESHDHPQVGVSRVTDEFGFFDGDRADVWSQSDIYEQEAENIYNIDARQDALLVGRGTMTTWRSDIYGNEYVLYKEVDSERSSVAAVVDDELAEDNVTITCETIDGGETLLPHPTTGPDFEYYDGGRHPLLDPKPEQSNLHKPFPDIREEVWNGSGFDLPEHNTQYYGYDPTGQSDEIGLYPITFHGFRKKNKSPAYDRQMYCGVFTDTECGVIYSNQDKCNIADNYTFQTFTDSPSGDNRLSSHAPLEKDAFEIYTAPGLGDEHSLQNPEYVGFSTWGRSDDIIVTESNRLDGSSFTSDSCRSLDAEYFYEINGNVPLYLGKLDTAETVRSEPRNINIDKMTLYQQKTAPIGKGFFRSYNGKVIQPLSVAVNQIMSNYGFFKNSDFDQIKDSIDTNRIINLDIIYDVLIVQTETHMYLEKIQFDPTTSELKPSGLSNVFLRTWDTDPAIERSCGWFFNEEKSMLLTGVTSIDRSTGEDIVYVKLIRIDLNTLQYVQVFPNNDYPEGPTEYKLTGDLATSTIAAIDDPIITYNETTDIYNITYSAQLSSNDGVAQAFIVSDFKDRRLNFQLVDTNIHYSDFVTPSTTINNSTEHTLVLPGSKMQPTPITPPTGGEYKTFNMSMSSILGDTLSAQSFNLTINPEDIPVNSNMYRINEIIIDYGDGARDVASRTIDANILDASIDITTMPDPSDSNDPRIKTFEHKYTFTASVPDTISARVSAVYGDFSVLIYNIDIETSPYTISSGFGGVKMIDSKLFTDPTGIEKQVITLETQNPQHITDVVLTR